MLNVPQIGAESIRGATVPVDVTKVLYRTDAYPDFQEALSRIDSELFLAFDRSLVKWVICREGRVIRRVKSNDGLVIGHMVPQPSVVFTIQWIVDQGPGQPPRFDFKVPDELTLQHIGHEIKRNRAMYEWDNSEAAHQAIMDVYDEAEDRMDKRAQAIASQTYSDFKSRIDHNSGEYKPMISVPQAV